MWESGALEESPDTWGEKGGKGKERIVLAGALHTKMLSDGLETIGCLLSEGKHARALSISFALRLQSLSSSRLGPHAAFQSSIPSELWQFLSPGPV